MIRRCLGVLLVLLYAGCASAQTTIQPTKIEFTASADHNTVVTGTTTPLISNYVLTVFAGPSVVLGPVSVGKPTPDTANLNMITVQAASVSGFLALPKNVVYTVAVAATGPVGISLSTANSNPFVFAPAPAAPGVPVVKP